MKVRALTTFGGTKYGHYSAGQVFDLPEGVDWLRAGLVERVETAAMKGGKLRTAEPVPLTDVPGIGDTYADRLRAGGVESAADVATADIGHMSALAEVTSKKAREWQKAAKEML